MFNYEYTSIELCNCNEDADVWLKLTFLHFLELESYKHFLNT